MKEDKQRQKLANWPELHWHFGRWASNSGLEMDHLSTDLDKAPGLSTSNNIWTLSSDTNTDIADSAQTDYCSTFPFSVNQSQA